MLGWFDEKAVREICGADGTVRLVITLGYPKEGDPLRAKKRKEHGDLFRVVE